MNLYYESRAIITAALGTISMNSHHRRTKYDFSPYRNVNWADDWCIRISIKLLSSSLFLLSFFYLDVFYRYAIRTNNIIYLRRVIIMSNLNMATKRLVFTWDHIPDKAWLRIYQLCTLCTNISCNLIANGY